MRDTASLAENALTDTGNLASDKEQNETDLADLRRRLERIKALSGKN